MAKGMGVQRCGASPIARQRVQQHPHMRGKGLAGKRTFGNRSRRLEGRFKPDSVFGKRQRGLPNINFGRSKFKLPSLSKRGLWIVLAIIGVLLTTAPGERTLQQSCAATRAQRTLVQRTLLNVTVREVELATQAPKYAGQPEWKTYASVTKRGLFGLWGTSHQRTLSVYADGTNQP